MMIWVLRPVKMFNGNMENNNMLSLENITLNKCMDSSIYGYM
jgi:hypothetical protein